MMRLVREHVSEHGPSGGPRGHPTIARELCNPAIRSARESIRQHPQALRGAFPVRGSSLLHGAAVGIKWRRTLQMRCGTLQPLETAVVQMREDGRDRPATAFFARRLSAPRTRVEMGEDQLVHGVVARVGFEQGVANLCQRSVGFECHRLGFECHGSSVNLLQPRLESTLNTYKNGPPKPPSKFSSCNTSLIHLPASVANKRLTARLSPLRSNRVEKSLHLRLAGLRIRWFDPIAEASELPKHPRSAELLRSFGDRWAAGPRSS